MVCHVIGFMACLSTFIDLSNAEVSLFCTKSHGLNHL